MKYYFLLFVMGFLMIQACKGDTVSQDQVRKAILPGIFQTKDYIPNLKDKKVALVVNHTSTFESTHLLDSLISLEVDVRAIFAPEHGFRGTADAGEKIDDGKDAKTGIPLYSLYGKNKKPSASQLADIDIVVFDIQDVGVRFYTYLSTLHYVMEACAEQGIPLIVLDRPNPNIDRVDGPVMEEEFMSFVGLHPVPIVYGMTIGEYAKMIKGEEWINQATSCDLTIVKCKDYTRESTYEVPIAPSPNLPNHRSIRLYPSLCLFEGTRVSIGRGTDRQFQLIGSPELNMDGWDDSFIPKPNIGSKYPKHQDQVCKGIDLTKAKYDQYLEANELTFEWLLAVHNHYQSQGHDFFNNNNFFEKLAGTASLRKQLIQGKSIQKIRASWHESLIEFRMIRRKYLIYQ